MTDLEAGLRAFHDGWRGPVRDHLARIPPEHPDRAVADALLAMVRYQEGAWSDAEADAARLTTSPDLEARRWAWLTVALSRLVRGLDARNAIAALQDLAETPEWRAHAALLSGDAAFRATDGATAREDFDRAVALAAAVDDPAVRGWLRYDAVVAATRLWPPERSRTVADAARRDFEAAGLRYGLASLAIMREDDPTPVDENVRVFTERGRTADAYRLRLTRASWLHQAGDLDGADAGYLLAAPLAGALTGKSLAPIRAVLALQRGRADEAARHLSAVSPPLLAGIGQAVAFVRAALPGAHDPTTALREAWLSNQGTVSPLGALAAGAAVERLGATASAAAVSRTRAFALRSWPARDPVGRGRLAARHAAAIANGAPIPCGDFDLARRLGAGGMGEVWAATWAHTDGLGAFVVKLVRGERVRDEAARRAFDREIRAVAALSHPNVVPIVDLGVTPPAEESGGRLEAGAPWFAMPRASGSMHEWRGRLPWPELRRALLSLLSALAHVHARGLVHLDVKPENLLVPDPADPGGIWLADFGQASLPGADAGIGGTPAFMAPEQFAGRPGAVGPAADLYAVGAVAWDLATGEPPHGSGNLARLRLAHATEEPPPLQARMPVPAGFEAWARSLLEKVPTERPGSAAEAAAALRALDEPAAAEAPGWRTVAHRPRGFAPSPALLQHRPPAFVGREDERDRLWTLLTALAARGGVELVVVTGTRGAGSTRLCRWIAEAAAEAGVARCHVAATAPTGPAPAVWWLDAPAATAVGAITAAFHGDTPTLVLVSADEDEWRRDPALARRLGVLDPATLTLGPLPATALDEALSSLVPLRTATRARLVEAAAGAPGRAVALLRRAADRGELKITQAGWALPPGWVPGPDAEATTPEPTPVDRRLLAAAAVLGDPVSIEEWAALCAALGLPSPLARLVAWSDAGLLTLSGDAARTGPRDARDLGIPLPEAHAACAALLSARGAPAPRVARHLLRAGDAEAAFSTLRGGLRSVGRPDGLQPDLGIADLLDACVAALAITPADDRWSWAAFQRASALDQIQDYVALREHCAAVEAALAAVPRDVSVPMAALAARAERWAGDPERALDRFRDAGDRAERARHFLATRLRYEAGSLARELGRGGEAEELFRRAVDLATDDAQSQLVAGMAWSCLGEPARAEAALHRARSLPGADATLIHSTLGEVYRHQRRWDDAVQHARAAVDLAATRRERSFHAVNLALALAGRGDVAQVLALLPACRPSRGARMAPIQRALVAILQLLVPSDAPWRVRWAAVEREVDPVRSHPDVVEGAEAVTRAVALPPELVARLLALGVPDDPESTFDPSID